MGHVRLSGFRVADNVVNGIEIQETLGEWGGPQIIVSMSHDIPRLLDTRLRACVVRRFKGSCKNAQQGAKMSTLN